MPRAPHSEPGLPMILFCLLSATFLGKTGWYSQRDKNLMISYQRDFPFEISHLILLFSSSDDTTVSKCPRTVGNLHGTVVFKLPRSLIVIVTIGWVADSSNQSISLSDSSVIASKWHRSSLKKPSNCCKKPIKVASYSFLTARELISKISRWRELSNSMPKSRAKSRSKMPTKMASKLLKFVDRK